MRQATIQRIRLMLMEAEADMQSVACMIWSGRRGDFCFGIASSCVASMNSICVTFFKKLSDVKNFSFLLR